MAAPNVTSVCVDVQPWSGASMIPYTSALSPTIDSNAPSGSSGAWIFSRDRGMRKKPATSATTTTNTLMRKIEPHQKFSSSSAADHAAHRHADTGEAGPDRDRPRPLVGREHVGQDRQRRRHHERGADAHHRTGPDHRARRARHHREQRRRTEHDQPAVEREPSTVAVTQAAGGEQQAGEHEAVGVDDPLQRARAGVEVAGQRRQRHVEAGVRHHDHHEADAQHAEGPPAALVVAGRRALLAVELPPERGLLGDDLFDGHRTVPTSLSVE